MSMDVVPYSFNLTAYRLELRKDTSLSPDFLSDITLSGVNLVALHTFMPNAGPFSIVGH